MADNSDGTAKRRKRGPGRPFPPGVSGNPGGRPKSFMARIQELTRDGEELIELALRIMRGEETIEVGGEKFAPTLRERMEALKLVTAYGYGLPTQPLEHAGADGGPLTIRVITETRGSGA